uniref:ABC transporter permease n=1 Tax=Steinernema glaseri TaxID=37863 RepID=A0A1I7YAL5_9BILA
MYAGYYPDKMYQRSLVLGSAMQRIQEEATFIHNAAMVMYSKERCLATYYAKTYEKTFTSWIAELLLGSFMGVLSVAVALIYRWQLVANHFIAYYLTALGIVSFVVVICLFNINRIMHARGRVLMLSLSERYQIHENVATCRMLVPVTVMHSVTQGVALGAIYWMIVKFERGEYDDFRAPSFSLDLSLAFSVFLMPVMVVAFNKRLKNQTRSLFGMSKERRRFEEAQATANAVAKEYFEQLNTMWK